MKCEKCGGTEINAHIESIHIHRVVSEEYSKIVLAANPKHIEDDETTFWCAACGNLIDDDHIDEMDITFEEDEP